MHVQTVHSYRAAVFTLYSYSKALEYPFRVPTADSLRGPKNCLVLLRLTSHRTKTTNYYSRQANKVLFFFHFNFVIQRTLREQCCLNKDSWFIVFLCIYYYFIIFRLVGPILEFRTRPQILLARPCTEPSPPVRGRAFSDVLSFGAWGVTVHVSHLMSRVTTSIHHAREVFVLMPQWLILPPFQIIRHSKNLGELKHLKFDQNYKENYKNL
jgi:hypothetical protein